jgi:hypothetical protein
VHVHAHILELLLLSLFLRDFFCGIFFAGTSTRPSFLISLLKEVNSNEN